MSAVPPPRVPCTVSVTAVAAVAGATSVPFNYAYQVFLFHQPPDALSMAGAAIILATTVGMAVAKQVAASREAAAGSAGTVGVGSFKRGQSLL